MQHILQSCLFEKENLINYKLGNEKRRALDRIVVTCKVAVFICSEIPSP